LTNLWEEEADFIIHPVTYDDVGPRLRWERQSTMGKDNLNRQILSICYLTEREGQGKKTWGEKTEYVFHPIKF